MIWLGIWLWTATVTYCVYCFCMDERGEFGMWGMMLLCWPVHAAFIGFYLAARFWVVCVEGVAWLRR